MSSCKAPQDAQPERIQTYVRIDRRSGNDAGGLFQQPERVEIPPVQIDDKVIKMIGC